MIAEAAFFLAAGLLVYTYVGYPCLVWLLGRSKEAVHYPDNYCPAISIVIVASNEAAGIQRKIRGLITADYPADRLEIIIASDGSTDSTVKLARDEIKAGHAPQIRVIEFKVRRGKSSVLNDVVPGCQGEIVVLADVRQRFGCGALRALASRFLDPSIGAVGGELVFVDVDEDGSEIRKGLNAYWRYEKFIRASESRLFSTVGVSGAIYAIRRDLFDPIPIDTILDDVLIPMQIVRRGFRVVLASEAHAYDRVSLTAGTEFSRKVRTIAGNFQLFHQEPWLIWPWSNPIWWQTVSHKLFRLLSPVLLVVVLNSSFILISRPLFAFTFSAQMVFYGAAVIGYGLSSRHDKRAIFNIPYTFCLLNWATVIAFWRFLRGQQRVTWNITHVR